MTRLVFCADLHAGNHKRCPGQYIAGLNRRAREAVATLRVAADLAGPDGYLVGAGDICDTSRPSPQLVAALQHALADTTAILLPGNHDRCSTEEGDHALASLWPVATIAERAQLIELPGVDLFCIPFWPGPAETWFPQQLAEIVAQSGGVNERVLALHLGIRDKETASFLKKAPDSIDADHLAALMAEHDISHAMAGNWHESKTWKFGAHGEHIITQCSALCPTGFDNPGNDDYGWVAEYDSERADRVRLHQIPGPRFITVHGPTVQDAPFLRDMKAAGCSIYVRWKTSFIDGARGIQSGTEELREWANAGLITDGFVLPDVDEHAETAARIAAAEARQSESIGEALAKFIEAIDLAEGVDRLVVLQRAQAYLGGVDE